jgi:hypothetical protein
MKTSSEIELFHMFYVAGISGEEEVNTEIYEILLVRYEEGNRSVQLRDSIFMKQRGHQ